MGPLCIGWPKYRSFSFSISSSNDYSGLISFRIDWFDLFAVQRTLKSSADHNFKASVLLCSVFFMVQLSHQYMATEKIIALTLWTFDYMPLLLNMLFRFIIVFLPQAKASFNFKAAVTIAVILEPKKRKSVTALTFSTSISHEVLGPDAMILSFLVFSFKSVFSISSIMLIKQLFSFSSLSAITVVWSAYLRLLIFLPAILIPAWDSSSPAFRMIYSSWKFKQGDNTQACHSPFLIWTSQLFHVWLQLLLLDLHTGPWVDR